MRNRPETLRAINNELDRELASMLMEISDTAERAARNIMILRKTRKAKGLNYDKGTYHRAGC
ncbi:MAG TPA: hypothetical protein OIL76_06340 [Veillonellaceae bacterium]|jgi:hypothetical protein|uniref:hypothetical protein n=1 Tax=uncultured Dialister sp. TaxID=278064 RepID=UPI0027DC9475|nr:hypothetical protein [uncultured Dialister sp.]HJI29652.1 hypothetical protein [Veillonellaceae bacterium]